jgi:citrate synthase
MADTLTITDNRTGRSYEVPVAGGAIRALDLRQIRAGEDDPGLMSYDPGFQNTAACLSRITHVDGARGELLYRGYPIQQLAEESSFLETAYLLLFGELPTAADLKAWTQEVTRHEMLHVKVKTLLGGFHDDAHPMGIFVGTMGALSTFYPDARDVLDEVSRERQTVRIVAKAPTIAAYAYRHLRGQAYVDPDNTLSYTGNFLNMLFRMTEVKYQPNTVLERALDVLFILHADHEQNCSTSTMRGIGSAWADPYTAVAGAAGALSGPLHGGANEAALLMLAGIGSPSRVPAFLKRVKAGEARLAGFGHRIYTVCDPRAAIIKRMADLVFAVTGSNPLLEVALELERIAREDEWFVTRHLYPNVDFYSGLIYQAMGFPPAMFPVLFAVPRTVGWLAQWRELVADPAQRIARPRQIYAGQTRREYVPRDKRKQDA